MIIRNSSTRTPLPEGAFKRDEIRGEGATLSSRSSFTLLFFCVPDGSCARHARSDPRSDPPDGNFVRSDPYAAAIVSSSEPDPRCALKQQQPHPIYGRTSSSSSRNPHLISTSEAARSCEFFHKPPKKQQLKKKNISPYIIPYFLGYVKDFFCSREKKIG